MSLPCRSCGKPIRFIEMRSGKKMPVDPDLIAYADAKDGDVLVTEQGNTYKVNLANRLPNVKGYVSHFATCPQADDWRKPRG